MPSEAVMQAGDPRPPRGTAGSFRLLTARLKRFIPIAPAPPPPVEEVLPAAAAIPAGPPTPGEAAAALLDIIWGAVDLPPQERSMASDTMLLLLPQLGARDLVMLAERVAAMDQPPPLLVSRLLRDGQPEIGALLLERSAHLDESDMIAACDGGDPERLRLLARRRVVPAALSDRIVAGGDLLSLLQLLRNHGAQISFSSFLRLSQMAGEHSGLQAPLALRTDLPLAVALDLLWRLPPELRRVIIARFLSDSVTLGRILAIGLAAGEGPVLADGPLAAAQVEAALEPLLAGRGGESISRLAGLSGLAEGTLARIFADAEGDALAVLLKALGLTRSRFDEALDRVRAATGLVRDDRPPEELKAVFDSLSFTKARVLLLYWDWYTRRAGPYAAQSGAGLVEAAPLA